MQIPLGDCEMMITERFFKNLLFQMTGGNVSGRDVRGMSFLGLLPSSRIAEVRLPANVLGTDMWSKRPPTNGEKLEHKQTDKQCNSQIVYVYSQVTFPESENIQRQ